MKIEHLKHKYGGTITEIRAVVHRTLKGVADWYFDGTVEWRDGGKSTKVEIAPFALCCDQENAEAKAELRVILDAMNKHLNESGEWHDMKHKRDGRCYSWTPKNPDGLTAL